MKAKFIFLTTLVLSALFLFIYVRQSASAGSSPYFPVGLINEATLYLIGESDTVAFSSCGYIPNEILDSVSLSPVEWREAIEIASRELSSSLVAVDCFEPAFVIVFRGGYHQYVSHLTVSFSCFQLKYADNSGIHILTEGQYASFQSWSEMVGGSK